MTEAPLAAVDAMREVEREVGHATCVVIAHGLAVLGVGLVAGVGLVFSLLDAVALWPMPAWEVSIPGSTRGWQAAHVGGITNGMLLVLLALTFQPLALERARARWLTWALIITGWGNTIFYWAGNLAPNRGLSVGDTIHGAGDFAGALAYFGGAAAMLALFCTVGVLLKASVDRLANRTD
ncbi:MAG: hypothetical protein VX766_01680 [Pseudomonadota bacterium]|nr:hypothetical protein [Pseudomonadota bacterium]